MGDGGDDQGEASMPSVPPPGTAQAGYPAATAPLAGFSTAPQPTYPPPPQPAYPTAGAQPYPPGAQPGYSSGPQPGLAPYQYPGQQQVYQQSTVAASMVIGARCAIPLIIMGFIFFTNGIIWTALGVTR